MKSFHSDSPTNLKYSPYSMRSTTNTTNFIEYVSKSNTGHFNAIDVSINCWNNLHNQVKRIDCLEDLEY